MILLLNVCGKRPGLVLDLAKQMTDVNRCIHALKQNEKRWAVAGRFVYVPILAAQSALTDWAGCW
jgi:hypothetical protein